MSTRPDATPGGRTRRRRRRTPLRRTATLVLLTLLVCTLELAAPPTDRPWAGLPAARANTVACPDARSTLVESVPATRTRSVALTFDDGPSPRWTGQVLDVLKRHDVKATFFVVGSTVRKHPDLVRRMHAEGHFIGNHTSTHPRLTTLTAAQQGAEMDGLTAAVQAVVPGYRPCHLRPPYGAWNPDTIAQARARGMSVVRWSHDTDDWSAPPLLDRAKQADIVARATAPGPSASHAIVLLHDGADGNYRQNTVASLDRIITAYKARGHTFTDASGRRSPTEVSASLSARNPFGSLDTVGTTPGRVRVRGWAVDPDTAAAVVAQVRVDGRVVTTTTASLPRPDVQRAHPAHGAARGYDATVTVTPGPHRVCVVAVNVGPGTLDPQLGCRDVVVADPDPFGHLDSVTVTPGGVRVRGWTADCDTSGPTPLRVTVDRRTAHDGPTHLARGDVQRAHPSTGLVRGFDVTVPATPGPRYVCVVAVNVGAGRNNALGCTLVTVPPEGVQGSSDGPGVP